MCKININNLDMYYFIYLINRLYEPFVLQKISQHYETKQPLPTETMESIKKIRSHLAGYKLCKELYLSHLDLELHSRFNIKFFYSKFWIFKLF